MAGPFNNHYTCRQVAAKDSKACAICYKPTTTVLITDNQVDFFYVCSSHLSDAQFATAIKPTEYQDLVKKRVELESQIDKTTQERYKHKPFLWNKVWGLKKPKEDAKEGDADSGDKYAKLTKELEAQQKELEATKLSIASYSFKNYQLDDLMFKVRLNHHTQSQAARLRQQKIEQGGFFPEVPRHDVT